MHDAIFFYLSLRLHFVNVLHRSAGRLYVSKRFVDKASKTFVWGFLVIKPEEDGCEV